MITKDEYIEILQRTGFTPSADSLSNFEEAAHAAVKLSTMMPGIGVLSVSSRLNCFYAVCRHLDAMIDDGELSLDDTQLALNILRLKDRTFKKAIIAFDGFGPRLGTRERGELPRSALEYLAGLEMYG